MNEEITCNKGLTHFWVVKVIFTICKLGRKRPVMFRHYGRMLTTLTTSSGSTNTLAFLTPFYWLFVIFADIL